MIHCGLRLRYDWPSGPEDDAVFFPLWRGYGTTAAGAHRAVLGILAESETGVILDADGEPWPVARETVMSVVVWDSARLRLNIPTP